MNKKNIVIITLIILSLTLGATVFAAPKGPKHARGYLTNGEITYYASYWSGQTPGDPQSVKKYSGRIWTAEGIIESIGHATVEVSACWDWGRSTPEGETNEIYTSDHQGALVVTTSQWFGDNKDWTTGSGPFECTATITITDGSGNEMWGDITGGSVYELVVFSPPDTNSINEWLIHFTVSGGTGDFENAKGTGIYRLVWDAHNGPGNPYSDITPTGSYDDPARFLEQNIFLSYTR